MKRSKKSAAVSGDPRYPIGNFEAKASLDDLQRKALIKQISDVPARVRAAVKGLNKRQLDTPYREGGWTVRQVVHHLPDSHINAYVRLRLALTEAEPTIKPYEEDLWSKLSDARSAPTDLSLDLLEGLHGRWTLLLKSMKAEDFCRKFVHPEHGSRDLDWLLQLYAWHGRHHVAQITSLRQRMGW